MHWDSFQHFLAMGGYGFFVWGSYGVTLVIIVAEIWALRSRRRTALRQASPAAGRSV